MHSGSYWADPKTISFKKQKIKRMLAMKAFELAQTACGSPIVFIPKKDGTPRFCTEYSKLNAVAIEYSYPIPRMHKCINLPCYPTIFSTLDAMGGY